MPLVVWLVGYMSLRVRHDRQREVRSDGVPDLRGVARRDRREGRAPVREEGADVLVVEGVPAELQARSVVAPRDDDG